MDRFESLSIVLAVAEAGSLSAAARRLNIPPATASRKIAELESHLRARLFDRSAPKLVLTAAGSSYVEAVKPILAELSEADRAVSSEYALPAGELVVTAPVGLGRLHLLPVVAQFLRAHPEIDVRLVLGDRILNLVEENVDLALRVGQLPDSRLMAQRVGAARYVVCASPDYLEAHGTPATPADLAGHATIAYEGFRTPDAWRFRQDGAAASVKVTPRLIVSTVEAACDAAAAGIGLARVLSYQAAPALAAGRLVTVLDDFAPEPLPVSLVHRAGRLLPIRLRAFLDFAAPRLKAGLAG